jgi:hypothetical protein
MRQDQAARLLSLGFSYIVRYDSGGQRVATWWTPNSWTTAFAPYACDAHASQAVRGQNLSGQIARTIAADAFSTIITILVPLPMGGFVIAAADRIVTDQVAAKLADDLTAAIAREFGPSYAPVIAAALVFALLVVVVLTRR